MPIERRWKLSAAGMAKRSFRRVSDGQDVRSERPTRWHGAGPAASRLPNEPHNLLGRGQPEAGY